MNQKPLELAPGCGHDVEALNLEVGELKLEEDQLRAILFKQLINK